MGKCYAEECNEEGKFKGSLCCLDCEYKEECDVVCVETIYDKDYPNNYVCGKDCPSYEFYDGGK